MFFLKKKPSVLQEIIKEESLDKKTKLIHSALTNIGILWTPFLRKFPTLKVDGVTVFPWTRITTIDSGSWNPFSFKGFLPRWGKAGIFKWEHFISFDDGADVFYTKEPPSEFKLRDALISWNYEHDLKRFRLIEKDLEEVFNLTKIQFEHYCKTIGRGIEDDDFRGVKGFLYE